MNNYYLGDTQSAVSFNLSGVDRALKLSAAELILNRKTSSLDRPPGEYVLNVFEQTDESNLIYSRPLDPKDTFLHNFDVINLTETAADWSGYGVTYLQLRSFRIRRCLVH